jgi:cell division protein FtsA
VQNPDRRITEEDVINATQAARGYTLPPDKQILHSCERGYSIDDDREVTNAIGLVGSKLEADVQIVYGQHNRLETNCRLLADVMGYAATDIAFSGVASAFAAFAPEDRAKGGLLIDIGAGLSEYVVLSGNGCYHCGQTTIGCDQIANDLAIGLRVPIVTARAILRDMKQLGCSAIMNPDGRARLMAVEGVSTKPRQIPRSSIEQIVELRLRELFEVIRNALQKQQALDRVGGVVKLCGGGALIPDVERLANEVFRLPVTIAKPLLLSGKEDILNSPMYLTPVGLIRWGKLMIDIEEEGDADESLGRVLLSDARSMFRLVRDALRW